MDDLFAGGSSTVTMSGGRIDDALFATDSSTVTLSGGEVWELYASDSSLIEIVGSGFMVEPLGGSPIPVPYGDLAALTGYLTGTLASGDPLDTYFTQGGGSYTGTIRLVPEPTTAFLLATGLACLAAAGRRRSLH